VCIACSAIVSKCSGWMPTADKLRGIPKPRISLSSKSEAFSSDRPIVAATKAWRFALTGLFHCMTAGSMMQDVCP
jgi:hypothetical protein